jgi:hypothetical protein
VAVGAHAQPVDSALYRASPFDGACYGASLANDVCRCALIAEVLQRFAEAVHVRDQRAVLAHEARILVEKLAEVAVAPAPDPAQQYLVPLDSGLRLDGRPTTQAA